MVKRTCQHCGVELDTAGTGRWRRYCSGRCKQAAYRQRDRVAVALAAQVEALPPKVAEVLADANTEAGSRLQFLIAHRIRLDAILDRSDDRTAAPLSREYRETLREIESLVNVTAESEEQVSGEIIETTTFQLTAI